MSVETDFTTQAVANGSREVAFLHELRVGARREREIEWAAVKSEFAAAEAVMLDAVRAATEAIPQEVVAQVAHTGQGMARLGKAMADVKSEVHKLIKLPKG